MVRSFAQIDFTLEGWDGADHLRAAALRGEDAIAEQVALRPELDGMATTLTAVLLQRDCRVVLLHSGDSRGYLFRDRRLYQLSKDDTFVQSLVDVGALSPDEARFHPQRNIVLRALTDEHRPERPVLLAVLTGVQRGCGSVAGSPRLLAAPALRPGLDLPVLTGSSPRLR